MADSGSSESSSSEENQQRRAAPRAGAARAGRAAARAERAGQNAVVAELQNLVAELRREVAELRGAQGPQGRVPVQPPSPPRQQAGHFQDYLTILEHMRRIGTSHFRGTTNPVDADAWLQSLKRNLSVSRCPEEFKKDVAVFLLERDATHWWQSVERRYGTAAISWDDFQREFQNKYFPPEARERLEVQFLQIKQGNLSVREYEMEFTRLSQYGNGGDMGEAALIRKFKRGLEPCLRNRLHTGDFQTLHELVECAVLLEEGLAEENAAAVRSHSRPPMVAQRSGRRDVNRPNQARRSGRAGGNGQGRLPFCTQCRTRHAGLCRQVQRPNVCYNCREPGHMARDCPKSARPSAALSAVNVTCFTCGEVGHFATSCPNRRTIRPGNERPALLAPPAKRQAVQARAYALEGGPSNTSKDGAKDKAKEKAKEPIAG